MPRSRNPFRLRKPGERPPRQGSVYFVQGHGGAIKIGFATDLHTRIGQLQTTCPTELRFLGSVEGTMALERAYHRQFKDYRLTGEWFSDCQAIRDEVLRIAPRRAQQLKRLWRSANA